jgi:hypothetical protein
MTLETVEIVHPSGERRVLTVDGVTRVCVTLRWPLAGHYDLYLKENVLLARSVLARKRGKCEWRAVDIRGVRDAVRKMLDPDWEKRAEMIRKHESSMPLGKVDE